MTLSPDQRVIRCSPVEVLLLRELLRDGARNEDIGARLNITANSVRTHLLRIYRRLPDGLTRIGLVLALIREQIVVVDLQGRVVEF